MLYRIEATSEEIISELTNSTRGRCLNCEDCGSIIESGERYWDIGGEILCDRCLALKYERRNGSSPFEY